MAFLRLIRYKNLLIIALLQYLLRYGLMLPILGFYNLEPSLSHFRFALVVLATLTLAISGYIINDYFDLKIDRINRPHRVVVSEVFSRRTVLLWHVVFTLIGVFIGLYLAYVLRKESYALMFLSIPLLLWFYSTTLKKQMLIGNLAIAFLTSMVAYLVVSVEFASLSRLHGEQILTTDACSIAWFWTTGFAFFAFVATLGREIIKDMEDTEGDKAVKCTTLPIELGIPLTKWVVVLLNIFIIVVLWFFFFWVPQLQESRLTLFYFFILITLPYLFLSIFTLRAETKESFNRASKISKAIMLFGILFVFVVRSFFI